MVLLLGCMGGYLLFLSLLTVAERGTVVDYEERIRTLPFIMALVPEAFHKHFGPEWYTVRHLLGLVPLGLLAAGASWQAGALYGRRRGRRVAGGLLAGVFGFVGLLEIIQIWVPGRHALLVDVLAGWAGIALGFVVGLILCWAIEAGGRAFTTASRPVAGQPGAHTRGKESGAPHDNHDMS